MVRKKEDRPGVSLAHGANLPPSNGGPPDEHGASDPVNAEYHPHANRRSNFRWPPNPLPPLAKLTRASTASKAPTKPTEGAKSAKKTSSKPAAEPSDEKKKRRKVYKETYSSYIYKGESIGLLLKQLHPDTGISNKAMAMSSPPHQRLTGEFPGHLPPRGPTSSTLQPPASPTTLPGLDYLQHPHTEAVGVPSIHRT